MFVQANQQTPMYNQGGYTTFPYPAPQAQPQAAAPQFAAFDPWKPAQPHHQPPQQWQPQPQQHKPQPPPAAATMMMPPSVAIPPRNQTYDQAVESPTLSSTFLSPVLMTAPSSTSSGSTECSTSLSLTSNFSNSPPHHGISSPSAMMPFLQQQHHVVCSPSPVVSLDPGNLQSAWVAPSSFTPMTWVASPTNFVQPLFHPSPTASGLLPGSLPQVVPRQQQHQQQHHHQHRHVHQQPSSSQRHFFQPKPNPQPTNGAMGRFQNQRPARKNVRVRCKACASSSCRNAATKELNDADMAEYKADRTELMKSLPEFFGEPQLNFEEFVHYAPVFRAKHVGGEETYYFKIPRTTKERELNIPQRLTELFIRTFGPENAPAKNSFDRISPHTSLCDVRMVVRSTVVKALAPVFTPWLQTMDDAQELFDIIFRYAGVSCVKDVCPTAPQIWCAVVNDDNVEESEGWENVGVVSLFNYHLFRRRIAVE